MYTSVGVRELDINNFQLTKKGTFSGQQAYKNSKLCNVLFTYQLADSLKGTGVTVNCVNPGKLYNIYSNSLIVISLLIDMLI